MWCSDRGETLVEFALASTIFFMTMFGTIEFGLAVWNYNTLSSLAQDGARWAAVRGSTCTSPCVAADNGNVQDYVRSRVLGMSPTSVAVTTTWPDGGSPSNAPGKTVQVRVDYTFTPLTALVPNAALGLHSTVQMKIAR